LIGNWKYSILDIRFRVREERWGGK